MSTAELFWVDDVQCKPQNGGMLTVGVNVPKPLRFPIKRKADDEATRKAVRQHKKFAAAAAALDAGASSSTVPPSQVASAHLKPWRLLRATLLMPLPA